MIPVLQTAFGKTGNCFSACLASLFEIPLVDVPNFFDFENGSDPTVWWHEVRNWLRTKGFGVMNLDLSTPESLSHFEGVFIVCGESERGILHATLWKDGKMIHDPHPEQSGIQCPLSVDMLYPLDPSRMIMV